MIGSVPESVVLLAATKNYGARGEYRIEGEARRTGAICR